MGSHRLLLLFLCAGIVMAQPAPAVVPGPQYRIQPMDVLEVHYRYTPEFDQVATVQPDGLIDLNVVGELKVEGLTTAQAKAAVLEKASLRLRDPEISVALKEFQKPYFVVGGEVTNPGRFEMRGPVTAVEAVAMAGGFKTGAAKHSQVILYRRVGPDLAQAELLNLKAAMSPSFTGPLHELQSGDLLIVPQNRISKVERLVKMGNLGIYWAPLP